MFDRALVGRVAQALRSEEGHIEKDWHVVRALGVLGGVRVEGVRAAFSGGTSLSKGWGLIRRFSEDIDFKVAVAAPSANAARKRGSVYRAQCLDALAASGFTLVAPPLVGNASRFMRASFAYGPSFPAPTGMRPEIKIEMTFQAPALDPKPRPVQSFLAQAAGEGPELPAYPCVDPVETAADKISALAWRAHIRDRASVDDDPTIVRHVHDLAALAATVADNADFVPLAQRILESDAKRTGDRDAAGLELLATMVPAIAHDPQWRVEYDQFVRNAAFGPDDARIGFDDAIAACAALVDRILGRRG